MDFVRYDTSSFYDNPEFKKTSKEYIKLEQIFDYLKETYSCFNPALKNEIYSKRYIKKPQIIGINKEVHSSTKNLTSCLNKLTNLNYANIYKKILIAIQVNDVDTFVNHIMNTCLNSKAYHELYVGLIVHLFNSENAEIRSCVVNFINTYFSVVFTDSFYGVSQSDNETYDDFCDRVSVKSQKLYTVKVYFMLHMSKNLSNELHKGPQDVLDKLYNILHDTMKINLNDESNFELPLLCLKDCFEQKQFNIPLLKHPNPLLSLLKIDHKYKRLLTEYLASGSPEPKIRFICLDILELLDKQLR